MIAGLVLRDMLAGIEELGHWRGRLRAGDRCRLRLDHLGRFNDDVERTDEVSFIRVDSSRNHQVVSRGRSR